MAPGAEAACPPQHSHPRQGQIHRKILIRSLREVQTASVTVSPFPYPCPSPCSSSCPSEGLHLSNPGIGVCLPFLPLPSPPRPLSPLSCYLSPRHLVYHAGTLHRDEDYELELLPPFPHICGVLVARIKPRDLYLLGKHSPSQAPSLALWPWFLIIILMFH